MLRFLLTLCAFMAVFYLFYYPIVGARFILPCLLWVLQAYARVTGATLRWFGFDIVVDDRIVASPEFVMEVVRGCDALESMALYVAAVVATPARPMARVVGVWVGLVGLAITNVVRLVSLFWLGARYPTLFDVAHIEGWQTAMVLITVALWITWAYWATRRRGAS